MSALGTPASRPDDRARVMALFEAALDRDVADRAAFVAAASGDDAALRREVEALLAADADASGFLERTPMAALRAAMPFARPESGAETGVETGVELLARLQRAMGPAYRVERELAGGGMSRVFVAEETRLGRRVVVKLLPPELARALDVERFHREVRLVATLRHPHIVPLLAAGESADGLLYYTMPYLEGESLRARLARDGPLPPVEVARVVREMADALAYAHRRGVVHRDVKPANVLVDGDHVLVSDFGIAKALTAASGEPAPDDAAAVDAWHNSLTARGLAIGTPAYMSPEQARGLRVDGRSDVYSLGLVAYELLTGTRATIVEAADGASPLGAAGRGARLPRAVEGAIGRALAHDPAARWQTADAFAHALDAALDAALTATLAGARRPWRRAGWALAGAATVAVVAAAGIAWRATRDRPGHGAAARPTVVVLPFANLGRPDDAYLVDGLAREIASRLSGLPGLGVIAWTGAERRDGVRPSAARLAGELGAGYALDGTVAWTTLPDASRRLRVVPRVVRAADGRAVWTETFETAAAELPAVQATVAARVAAALAVPLDASGRRAVAAPLTRSAPAFDAYLRGGAAARGTASDGRPVREEAVRQYERAVALDPAFAAAWAQLALAHWRLYEARDDATAARRERARAAAARAFALDSTLPEAALALGQVADTRWGAVERYVVALRAHPDHPELLQALGWQQLALGRPADALATLGRAAALDPRSPAWPGEIANIHDIRHEHGDAVRVRERQIALDPTRASAYVAQALSYVNWRGDTAAARGLLARASAAAGRWRLVQVLAGASGVRVAPVLWPLLDAETRAAIDTLTVAGARRPPWRVYRLKAEHFARGGHAALARAYHDSTRAAALAALAALHGGPADPELHEALGIAYAGLGRAADALREGRRAVALDTADVNDRPWTRFSLAGIAARVGAVDVALASLESGLPTAVPGVSPYWLRLDPVWAPLRAEPRFRRLLDAR